MQLNELKIELNAWGTNKGKYTGKISYTGPVGNVELLLSPEISDALLRDIGGHIVKFSAATAKQLEATILDSVAIAQSSKAIEA